MRKILLIICLAPLFAFAQFKRSATELAKETIKEYVTEKLFKNSHYQAIEYGDLQRAPFGERSYASAIPHSFQIEEFEGGSTTNKTPVWKKYRFMFYFDEKMNVVFAKSYLE